MAAQLPRHEVFSPEKSSHAEIPKNHELYTWLASEPQAFEQRLADNIRRQGDKTLDEVINRLRASKASFESEQYQEGLDAGQEWANNVAEAADLMRLEQQRARVRGDLDRYFSTHDTSEYCAPELFVFLIWPEHDGDGEMAAEFWERAAGAKYPVDSFVSGFAKGALEVWDQVSAKL